MIRRRRNDRGRLLAACAAALISLASSASARALTFDEVVASPDPGRIGLLADAIALIKERAAPAKSAGKATLVHQSYRGDVSRLLSAFPAARRNQVSARAWARLEQAVQTTAAMSSAPARVRRFEQAFDLVELDWNTECDRLQRLVQLAEQLHFGRNSDAAHSVAEEATVQLKEVHSTKRPLTQNKLLAPLLLSHVLFSTGSFQAAAKQLLEALQYSPECLDIPMHVDSICPSGDHAARLQALQASAAADPALTLLLGYQMMCGGKVPAARQLLAAAVQKWPDRVYLASFKEVLDN